MSISIHEENMVKISELHKNTAKYIREAQKHPIVVFRYSQPEVVLTDFKSFKGLKEHVSELEEMVDRLQLKAELEKRRKETKGKVSLEKLQEKYDL